MKGLSAEAKRGQIKAGELSRPPSLDGSERLAIRCPHHWSLICNDAGAPGKGVGKLFDAALVSTLTASHIGLNPKAQQQTLAKLIVIDPVPQGTLVERIRAGGCGLDGVLTPTGVGTIVEEGKQKVQLGGKTFLMRRLCARTSR